MKRLYLEKLQWAKVKLTIYDMNNGLKLILLKEI